MGSSLVSPVYFLFESPLSIAVLSVLSLFVPGRHFVSRLAGVDVEVDRGRNAKAVAMGDLLQIEGADVEYVLLLMRGVRLNVTPVAVLGRFMEEEVLRDQLL